MLNFLRPEGPPRPRRPGRLPHRSPDRQSAANKAPYPTGCQSAPDATDTRFRRSPDIHHLAEQTDEYRYSTLHTRRHRRDTPRFDAAPHCRPPDSPAIARTVSQHSARTRSPLPRKAAVRRTDVTTTACVRAALSTYRISHFFGSQVILALRLS